jgi:NADPH2:quinone reductase
MRAIRVHEFGDPEVMRLEEASDPRPGPGQVVVRVEAAGVNPVDVYIRSGAYARMPALPYTPGLDAAGIVEAVGPGVGRLGVGARVYVALSAAGTYAEQTLCDEPRAHPLPESLSFAQGAAVGVPYATAWRALFQRARAVPGETVLVHGGSGGVGLAAVQIARAAGLRVIATAGTPEGRDLVAREGAHEALDHGAPGCLDEVVRLTGGGGADVILEMLANVNLGRDLKALAPGGRVVIIGSRGTVTIDPRDAMGRDAAVLGMSLFNATAADLAAIHAALLAGLSNGTLRPVVGRTLPLAQAAQAHRAVMEPGAGGKIVLVP